MVQEDKLDDFRHDFALLIEAGFVAVKQLDETSARRLFEAAQVLKPDSTAPRIGLGYISLNKLEVKEASVIFEEVLKQEPDNYLAQAFLGISYLLVKAKRSKGEELINDACEKSDDPTIKICVISPWNGLRKTSRNEKIKPPTSLRKKRRVSSPQDDNLLMEEEIPYVKF